MKSISVRVWDGERIKSLSEALFDCTVGVQSGVKSNKVEAYYDHVELLSFINAIDRQGNDIYTDYIVEVLDDYYDKLMISMNPWVVHLHGCQCIVKKQINGIGAITIRDMPNSYFLKVIGNIYENPELLEGVE